MARRTWMALLGILAACLMAGTLPCWANDTEAGFHAGQPYPLKSTTLRLLAEDLRVDLEPHDAVVEVTFKLRNEGPAREVTLGFPYYTRQDLLHRDETPYAGHLLDFECRVDGEPVATTTSRGNPIHKGWKSTSWQTWKVHFGAGQTRSVWHRFRGELGSSTGGRLQGRQETTGVRFFDYILTTARNWKAPIGEFRLVLRAVPPMRLSDIFAVSLPGLRRQGDVLTVTRRNYVPAGELQVQLLADYIRRPLRPPSAWVNPEFKPRKGSAPESLYPPGSKLARALREAASQRYNGSSGGRYRIVAYKTKYFASTEFGAPLNRLAVWEYLQGQWRFVFEYDPEKVRDEAGLDQMYARHQFSPRMRARLIDPFEAF